jgi:transcriptional regulator with XRE-family HTH domain
MMEVAVSVGESPTFQRFQLGKQLRALREVAGLTTEEVGSHLDCSASTVSRIEGGRVGVRHRSLICLMDLYGVTDREYRKTLQSLGQQGKQRGWLARYGDLPHSYSRFIGLESAAVEMRDYEALVVPGLLQTTEYHRALMLARWPDYAEPAISSRVRIRAERQTCLTRAVPLRFQAVLDESVIRRMIGGPGVMRAQLKYLVELSGQSNVTIQVLPFSGGAYAGMAGSFALLAFSNAPSVVYAESLTGDIYQDSDDVRRYGLVFENLRAAALSPDESTKLIDSAASERLALHQRSTR